MNFRFVMGTIGILLIVCNIPLLFFPTPIFSFVVAVCIPVYQDVMTWYSLFVLNMTAGLVLYVIGRKEFANHVKDIRISVFKDILEFRISSILTLLGLISTVDSLAFLSLVAMGSGSRTPRDWAVHPMLLAWGGLTFLSGVLWLIDGARTGEDEVPPLKKRVDSESQIEYPKDLLVKYVIQYPHNPTGVLEWHIHKKMKEGKTREQAIKELVNIMDGPV